MGECRAGASLTRVVQVPVHGCCAWKPATHLTWVRCLHGTAWVTMSGDLCDHVLRPGELVVLRGRGLAALQALGVADALCLINEPISTRGSVAHGGAGRTRPRTLSTRTDTYAV